ncbi:MAG: phosphotransferase family protein, partial [Chloroflexota bacterium]
VERLPHGYTNLTRRRDRGSIEKRYTGSRRWQNFERELACLTHLQGLLPVPRVIDADRSVPRLLVEEIRGEHGQDLIERGHGRAVLELTGTTLARLQRLPPDTVPTLMGNGAVLVHGDFGPQNMLFDLASGSVAAVVDWESARIGQRVEDLAWAEWIVRMHHPDLVGDLSLLFESSGQTPQWEDRKTWMLRQCKEILDYCESEAMTASAQDWRTRLRQTTGWREP